jgi:Alpha/beta hydrolase domain
VGTVSGPLPEEAGSPFGSPKVDWAGISYRVEEYLLQGEAVKYGPKSGVSLGRDGRWAVEPVGSSPYLTRFIVYRPVDPGSFNGTVLVSWNNVTAGFDSFTVDSLALTRPHPPSA